ncbi:MAG: hypothetical protein V7K41_22310 [Nostoc sp.]|uniref:hypothetical protein n=1 Tax=Nostoc sp. TaxID=1180 RepID=UPI002FF72A51
MVATIVDQLGTWEQLGEVTLSNEWQLFPFSTLSEIFRIKTTILNQQDWDKLKIRSGAYISFFYSDSSQSPNIYIPVSTHSIIRELPVPKEFQDSVSISRAIACIFSHRLINRYSLSSFAQWKLKLEALA